MFQDLDTTLANILDDAAAPATLVAAEVTFATPEKGFAPQLADTSVNLFLYEVKENRELRDPVPIRERVGDRFLERRPPLRVDCSYLVTAWATTQSKVADEHALLALAFARLSRFPVIPDRFLAGSLVGQPFPPPTMVAQWDTTRNAGEFWSALGVPPRPYFNLVVTIAMDLAESVAGAIVTTTITGYQQTGDAGSREERISIGGSVLDPGGRPVPDAWVRLEPDGATVVTDGAGRFVFPSVTRGSNRRLLARASGLGEAERPNVDIPSFSGEYNVRY